MAAHAIPEEKWALKLAAYLTGKAQLAYAGLCIEDSKDYQEVKAAILRRYITEKKLIEEGFGRWSRRAMNCIES